MELISFGSTGFLLHLSKDPVGGQSPLVPLQMLDFSRPKGPRNFAKIWYLAKQYDTQDMKDCSSYCLKLGAS